MGEGPHDNSFGEIVVKNGWATQAQVTECLSLQQRLRRQGKKERLGYLMAARGYLTLEQVEEAIACQGKLVWECPRCRKRFNVTGVTAGLKLACQQCGGELRKVSPLDSPRVDDTINTQGLPVPRPPPPPLDPLIGKVIIPHGGRAEKRRIRTGGGKQAGGAVSGRLPRD